MNKQKYIQSKHWIFYAIEKMEYKLAWHYFKRLVKSVLEGTIK